MRRRSIFFISLTVAVVAAVFAVPLILRTLIPASLTLSSQPDFVATREKAVAEEVTPASGIKLLAITEKGRGLGLQARPVDPTTLADLPTYPPIDFGHHYTYVVSPDRNILAVMTWPNDSGAGGRLHLIPLEFWMDTLTDLKIDDYVSDLTFSADGKILFWIKPTAHDPAHGMPRDYQLYGYDLDHRQVAVIAKLPPSFIPWFQGLSSGKLAVFGVPTDPENLTKDVPHILFIDPIPNRTVTDKRLDGVKAGQFREAVTDGTPSAQEESWQYVMYKPGLAWDMNRKVLYIVNADSDKVTTVDLVNARIINQTLRSIHPRESFLDWLSNLLAPVAEAKGGPWLGMRVILSGDGKRLYALREKTQRDLPQTTDLRLIATEGMRDIAHLNDLLTDFALTPDGKSLLVIKAEIDKSQDLDRMVSRDLYILDPVSLKERVHIRIDQVDQLTLDGFSPDGRQAYLRGSSTQWMAEEGWRTWRTTWQSLDLDSYRLISTRDSESLYGALLHIAP